MLPVAVVVPPVTLLPLATVMLPPVAVVVPHVAVLPLAGVVPPGDFVVPPRCVARRPSPVALVFPRRRAALRRAAACRRRRAACRPAAPCRSCAARRSSVPTVTRLVVNLYYNESRGLKN